jgi:hypothetical protein
MIILISEQYKILGKRDEIYMEVRKRERERERERERNKKRGERK